VAEEEEVAAGDPVADLGLPDLAVLLVGDEHHHDVAPAGRLDGLDDLEAAGLGLSDAGGVGAEADDDVDAGVLEVQGVGVALGAEADDRDGLAVEEGEVSVVVVVHGRRILSRRRSSDPTASPAPTSTHSAIT
jgi:hypothetical protein